MVALRNFLVDHGKFRTTDFTLSHWHKLNDDATAWETAAATGAPIPAIDWADILPFLDVWLEVEKNEFHHVQKLIPTLDWNGGRLGVRLRYEPDDNDDLQRDYLKARSQVLKTVGQASGNSLPAAPTQAPSIASTTPENAGGIKVTTKAAFSLWPESLVEFLERNLDGAFTVQAYKLDPAKLESPKDGIARPQSIDKSAQSIGTDPFKGLIAVDEIPAQRGFGHVHATRHTSDGFDGGERPDARIARRLSKQLGAYYARHLDPYDMPEPKDFEALQALEEARRAFDVRLEACFDSALKELEKLGYPGVTDPKLTVSTKVGRPSGLTHNPVVQYQLGKAQPSEPD